MPNGSTAIWNRSAARETVGALVKSLIRPRAAAALSIGLGFGEAGASSKPILRLCGEIAAMRPGSGRRRAPPHDLSRLLVLRESGHVGRHLEEGAGVAESVQLARLRHGQDLL